MSSMEREDMQQILLEADVGLNGWTVPFHVRVIVIVTDQKR